MSFIFVFVTVYLIMIVEHEVPTPQYASRKICDGNIFAARIFKKKIDKIFIAETSYWRY